MTSGLAMLFPTLCTHARRVLLLCVICACASPALCADADLLVRNWTPSQDARQRSVLALLETRSGYLWIGTGKGLLRFDGVSFTSFTASNTPGILGDRISFGTLWEDNHGVLWAGTDFTGVLRNDHGHWQTLQQRQGLAAGKVLRVDGDEKGSVWIYTEKGVSRWTDGHLELITPSEYNKNEGDLVPFSLGRGIDFAKAGLWRHSVRGVERFSYGHWTTFPAPTSRRPFEDDVREIYEDRLRRVWYSLFSHPGSLFCVENGRLRTYEGLPAQASVSYEDRDGYLWLTDHKANSALWRDGRLYPLPGLKAPFLLQVLETRNGTLWAGTAGTDLYEFRRPGFSFARTAGSPEIASVLFQQKNGQIWAGGTGVVRDTAGSGDEANFAPFPPAHQPENWRQILALAEDPGGRLLVGSRGTDGIQQLDHGRFLPYHTVSGTVRALLLTHSGELWIGSSSGVYREIKSTLQRLSSIPARCLFEASANLLWAGTDRGPLIFRDGQEQASPWLQRWSYGAVVALKPDASGDLWMATQDHGLVLSTSAGLHHFDTTDGLPTDTLYSLEFDDAGDLWTGSDVGLLRIRRRSIERRLEDRSSRLQVTTFDAADGLPASIFDPLGNEGSLRRPNGDLWFGTEQGVALIQPSRLHSSPSQTHPVIEEHGIDANDLSPEGPIELRPGQTNLQIHYTALGSDHPEQLIFRYRLKPYDREWIDAHSRRVAYYSHLPPGSYTFEVQTADEDGEGWENDVARAGVRVLTPVYRSWWFLSLVALVSLALLWHRLDQRRRRVLREQRNRQIFTHRLITTQEGERKRIAHELHDSIGQHLALIRTLALLPQAPLAAVAGGHLEAIAEQAAVAIKEVETISYDLRPYQLDRLGLTKAVLSTVQTLERSSSLEVSCSVDNVDGFFPKDLEINFYRIVQEALGNILHHAEATQVSVTVARTGPLLRLSIKDNGKGFAASADGGTGSGLGLIGIQERAEALGGHATIESAAGLGTTVLVEATQDGVKGRTAS